MQRESMYRGRATLARTLHPQPTKPTVKVRLWGRMAWLVVAIIAALAFWSTT